MKQVRAIVLFLLIGGCSFVVAYRLSHAPQTFEPQASPQTSDQQCDPTLWQYVYHPARLQVLGDPCISVTGSVEGVRKEADGDLHILFRLDQQFESLVNEKNISSEYGDLILEPICQGTVRQADATEPCSGYSGPYFEPQIGQRYLVSGTHVHDLDHGWNEFAPCQFYAANPIRQTQLRKADRLRHSKFVALRDDKNPRQAVREAES